MTLTPDSVHKESLYTERTRNGDLVERLKGAHLYEGHGEESALPEEAATAITELEARAERAEARIADLEAAIRAEHNGWCLGDAVQIIWPDMRWRGWIRGFYSKASGNKGANVENIDGAVQVYHLKHLRKWEGAPTDPAIARAALSPDE